MSSQTPSFITSTGWCRIGRHPGGTYKQNVCNVRASATPTPPAPEGEPGKWSFDDKKVALEKLLAIDMSDTNAESDGGKCTCIWCDGSGKRRCAWCKGEGTRMETMNSSWEQLATDSDNEGEPMKLPEQVPTVCSACSGSCVLRCAYCRGSGIGSYGMGYGQKE